MEPEVISVSEIRMAAEIARWRKEAGDLIEDHMVVLDDGHFVLWEGTPYERHSDRYVNAHVLVSEPGVSVRILTALIAVVKTCDRKIFEEAEFIAGPVTSGYGLARDLTLLLWGERSLKLPRLRSVALDKADDEGYMLRPYYARIVAGRKGVFIDDVRRSGRTEVCCLSEIQQAHGQVLACLYILDSVSLKRRGFLGIPSFSLQFFQPGNEYMPGRDTCPRCQAGEPITQVLAS